MNRTVWCELRKACKGTRTGLFRPVLIVGATRQRLPRRVCWPCREAATIGDFVSDQAWTGIVQGFTARGNLPPERTSLRLEFEDADAP